MILCTREVRVAGMDSAGEISCVFKICHKADCGLFFPIGCLYCLICRILTFITFNSGRLQKAEPDQPFVR